MTITKKTRRGAGKKLKLKKETLTDLEPKRGAIKGGAAARTEGVACYTGNCESKYCRP
jgi:hypothetical protein